MGQACIKTEETGIVHIILVVKPQREEEMCYIQTLMYIKMDLQEKWCEGGDWTKLTQGRFQ